MHFFIRIKSPFLFQLWFWFWFLIWFCFWFPLGFCHGFSLDLTGLGTRTILILHATLQLGPSKFEFVGDGWSGASALTQAQSNFISGISSCGIQHMYSLCDSTSCSLVLILLNSSQVLKLLNPSLVLNFLEICCLLFKLWKHGVTH
jgi:hypothetical protein